MSVAQRWRGVWGPVLNWEGAKWALVLGLKCVQALEYNNITIHVATRGSEAIDRIVLP
jgi:hypothetical protein